MQTGRPDQSSSHATCGSITVNAASRGAHKNVPNYYSYFWVYYKIKIT